MAPGVRLKKSFNGSRTSGRRKNTKFDSDEGDTYRKQYSDRPKFRSNPRNGEGEGRGYLSTEKKFARRGEDSGFKQVGRRPINGGRRDFGREDSSGTHELRGERREGRGRRVEIPHRSEVIDELRSRGRKLGWKRRVERGVNSEETMGPKARELRGDCRRTRVDGGGDDSGGTREMRGYRERREGRRNEEIHSRNEVTDRLRSRGRKLGRKRRDENGVDNSDEMDRSVESVEASSDKFRLKWKKMDKKRKDGDGSDFVGKMGRRGGRDDGYRDKGKKMDMGNAKGELLENGSDQVAEEKPVRRLTRVLDKTGNKIRVVQKRTDDVFAEKHVPAKKKKRVIKLDPYDISNKRLDDTAPSDEKNEENDTEISKNAEFRAIQPSPSILSFVEDNLLGRRRLNELKNAGYNIKLSAPLDNVPFSTCTERERIEENVFRNKLDFFAAAKISPSFPPPTLPEIAFAGRSNVGKSSLLNALTRQWGVVRTSDKPGLTQTINFFKLASKLCLVDLPGYGFAYAKEEVKDAWEELVKEYVSTRVGLERVCVVVDTKWGMKPRDHELIDLMERSQTPYQIVLTKTDLVFPIDVARRAMQIQDNLKKNKSIINPVMMVSSKSGAGIRNLRTVLSKLTRFVKP